MSDADVERSRPDWWLENERYKEWLDLPPYEPPRFADGTYVHEIVEPLEASLDCEIQFIGVHIRYEDDWEIRLDGETAFPIGRFRNENGNTIYEMGPDEFERRIRAVEAGGSDE